MGLGFDVHPFGDVPPLVLGGVRIADAPRLAGHSDGDAIAHAVADALLGPVGLPDLGTLFPASDESLRDADSLAMLGEVVVKIERGGLVDRQCRHSDRGRDSPAGAVHVGDGREPRGGTRACEGTDGPRHQRVGSPEASGGPRRDRPFRRHRSVGRRALVAQLNSQVFSCRLGSLHACSGSTTPPRAPRSTSCRGSRDTSRCTCAARRRMTCRTSVTGAKRSCSTRSAVTCSGPGCT